MNTNIKKLALVLGAALTFTLLGCNRPSSPETSNNSGLSAEEQELQKKTKQVAVESLRLRLEGAVDAGHKDNFSGLRSENITFTQRLDSRTYVAYDKRFSNTKETGIYKEADESLLKRSHELLHCARRLDVFSLGASGSEFFRDLGGAIEHRNRKTLRFQV